jgi:hypothetical protein
MEKRGKKKLKDSDIGVQIIFGFGNSQNLGHLKAYKGLP